MQLLHSKKRKMHSFLLKLVIKTYVLELKQPKSCENREYGVLDGNGLLIL